MLVSLNKIIIQKLIYILKIILKKKKLPSENGMSTTIMTQQSLYKDNNYQLSRVSLKVVN